MLEGKHTGIAHQAVRLHLSVMEREKSPLHIWCSQHFAYCVRNVYKIYFPTSKPMAREEKTTQDVNRGNVILCGVEWVRGSNKFVSYTSFNKVVYQKFPRHSGSVWEAFLLADTE